LGKEQRILHKILHNRQFISLNGIERIKRLISTKLLGTHRSRTTQVKMKRLQQEIRGGAFEVTSNFSTVPMRLELSRTKCISKQYYSEIC